MEKCPSSQESRFLNAASAIIKLLFRQGKAVDLTDQALSPEQIADIHYNNHRFPPLEHAVISPTTYDDPREPSSALPGEVTPRNFASMHELADEKYQRNRYKAGI